MTAAVCGPDPAADNSAFNDKAVAALASQYGKRERCGVAEPIAGTLEVYFIPRGKLADKLMSSLARKSKPKLRGKGDMLMVAVHKRGIGPDVKPLPAEQPQVPHASDPLPNVAGGRGTPPPNVSSAPRDDRPGADDIQDLLNQVNSQFGAAHPPSGMPPPLAPPPPIGGGLNVTSGPFPGGPPPPIPGYSPSGRGGAGPFDAGRARAPPMDYPPRPPQYGAPPPRGYDGGGGGGYQGGGPGPYRGGRSPPRRSPPRGGPGGFRSPPRDRGGYGSAGFGGPPPGRGYDRGGGPSPPRDRNAGFGSPGFGGPRVEVSGAAAPRGVGTGPRPDPGVPIPTDTARDRGPRRGTIADTAETGAARNGGTSLRPRDGTRVASDAHREHYRTLISTNVILSLSLLLHVLGVLRAGRSPRAHPHGRLPSSRGPPFPILPFGFDILGDNLGDILGVIGGLVSATSSAASHLSSRSCSAVSRSRGSDLSRAWITRFASGEMLLHTGFSYSLCRVTSMRLRSPSDSLLASNR